MGKSAAQIKNNGLTEKQVKFVDEYMLSLNAADAAKKAGYAVGKRGGGDSGSQLIRNYTIRREIDRRFEESRQGHRHTRDDIISEYEALAFGYSDKDKYLHPLTRMQALKEYERMMGYDKDAGKLRDDLETLAAGVRDFFLGGRKP